MLALGWLLLLHEEQRWPLGRALANVDGTPAAP